MIWIVGPLADPQMREVLAPDAVVAPPINGVLKGGARAGIDVLGWPHLSEEPGQVDCFSTPWTPELRRYAQIFDLQAQDWHGREVLGLGRVLVSAEDTSAQPQPQQRAGLAAALARWLVGLPHDIPAAKLHRRIPMIASWVASRLRAGAETPDLPDFGPQRDGTGPAWTQEDWAEPYAAFFSVEELGLRHLLHQGGWSERLLRAVFVSADAAVVLPWDMHLDRVLLIDQFRAAPAVRGDQRPWLYETIAGRVDAGETPEQAAYREAQEEAGLTLSSLINGPHNYPSPGILAEYLYLYVGLADLPDGIAGISGLESEAEDIRSHLVARAELTRMALGGQIRNGPLLTLALWLELNAARIRREAGLT